MPLDLLTPPVLVEVRDLDGALRPALLIGRRDGRCSLQVSRGAGDNVLRWLPCHDVREGTSAPPLPARVRSGPVQLRQPRSWR